MAEQFYVHEFENGLTLLAQPMEGVSSAAVNLSLMAGPTYDPANSQGAAAVASEWITRGAGELDSRALNDALDALGCQHHETAAGRFLKLNQSVLGRNLSSAMALLADMVRRPRLTGESFEPCRMLIRQDLASLEDEPARKAVGMLKEKFFPDPLGRMPYGQDESLQAMTADGLREHLHAAMSPVGAILAVAGNVDWETLKADVDSLFGDWAGQPVAEPEITEACPGEYHIPKESAQAHITLASPSVTIHDGRYWAARMAESVLSQGMGSRLFTEVREKRGLCYHISCQYASLKDQAGLFCYAGTRPDLASQTLDVTLSELARLAEGVDIEELDRSKTQLRSSLIMQGQSTIARASALAGDWYHLGRLRSLDEISGAIQAVSQEEVMDYVRTVPLTPTTRLIIGPEAM